MFKEKKDAPIKLQAHSCKSAWPCTMLAVIALVFDINPTPISINE